MDEGGDGVGDGDVLDVVVAVPARVYNDIDQEPLKGSDSHWGDRVSVRLELTRNSIRYLLDTFGHTWQRQAAVHMDQRVNCHRSILGHYLNQHDSDSTGLQVVDSLLNPCHREPSCGTRINTHLGRHFGIVEGVSSQSPRVPIGYAALEDVVATRAWVWDSRLGEGVYVHSPCPTAFIGTGRLACRGTFARRC